MLFIYTFISDQVVWRDTLYHPWCPLGTLIHQKLLIIKYIYYFSFTMFCFFHWTAVLNVKCYCTDPKADTYWTIILNFPHFALGILMPFCYLFTFIADICADNSNHLLVLIGNHFIWLSCISSARLGLDEPIDLPYPNQKNDQIYDIQNPIWFFYQMLFLIFWSYSGA